MAAHKLSERRKFPRLKHGVRVIYKFMGIIGEKKDEVIDVGQGGIRIFLKDKTEKGTILELAISITSEASPFFALAKVVWQSSKRKFGSDKKLYYETGVEFLKMDMQHKMLMIEYIYSRIKKERKAKKV
jgi:c-di-GMP-binding flagellar brake protein YcgR